ncbi:hypothetical protein HNQ94_000404 [Salirhabdus euzebyi]|uniref:Phage protein n=1 Tax=Salirhabdus euzebyi TaxID=394506 RepID=A0A841Q1D9_9BACI|nr:hypothetical protein [Salirhabdus euzebyi]MBB6451983.1 hypothetical protein [Salirhabdus euzebyi]
MIIELLIDGQKKTFTAPIVPMLAKRKYYEIMAKAENREGQITYEEQMREDDEMYSILVDVVFKNQFTFEQLFEGATQQYAEEKLREAIFGIKPKQKEDEEGNEKGE